MITKDNFVTYITASVLYFKQLNEYGAIGKIWDKAHIKWIILKVTGKQFLQFFFYESQLEYLRKAFTKEKK